MTNKEISNRWTRFTKKCKKNVPKFIECGFHRISDKEFLCIAWNIKGKQKTKCVHLMYEMILENQFFGEVCWT